MKNILFVTIISLASANFAQAEDTYTDVAVVSSSVAAVGCGMAGLASIAQTRKGDPRRAAQAVGNCVAGGAVMGATIGVGGVMSVLTQDHPSEKELNEPVAHEEHNEE